MKKVLKSFKFLVPVLVSTNIVFANTDNTQSSNSRNCDEKIEERTTQKQEKTALTPLSRCEQLTVVAGLNGKSYEEIDPPKRTVDNKVTCVSKGGYTLDYKYCVYMKNLYDGVIMAEQAMFAQQKIRVTENNNKLNADIEAAQKKGDLQNAALKATQEKAEQSSALFKEQAITYSGLVTTFSSALAFWPPKKASKFKSLCSGVTSDEKKSEKSSETYQDKKAKADVNISATQAYQDEMKRLMVEDAGVPPHSHDECVKMVSNVKESLFSNSDARSQFWLLNSQFLQKSAEAWRMAGLAKGASEAISNAPQMNDEETVALDPCVVDPSRPECKTAGPRRPTAPTLSGGAMDFGSMGGSQAFDMGTTSGVDLSDSASGPAGSDSETVASVASPFEKQAKEASGILNPSSAASISSGSQNSPAAGGPGGGPSGGSASLDDDLQGADQNGNKEPEITSTKVSTKSASGGGAGFQAVKKMNDDKDPYASIFGAKDAAGGIEEDRSIASDIDGAGSELFQKISKRYGQAQQDKRIEGQKLE